MLMLMMLFIDRRLKLAAFDNLIARGSASKVPRHGERLDLSSRQEPQSQTSNLEPITNLCLVVFVQHLTSTIKIDILIYTV